MRTDTCNKCNNNNDNESKKALEVEDDKYRRIKGRISRIKVAMSHLTWKMNRL